MEKKRKFKFYLYIVLTPIITLIMLGVAINTREKPKVYRESSENHTQRELLDVINHNHTIK